MVKKNLEKKEIKTANKKDIPTLQLRTEDEIAMDFAVKTYKKFNKIVKSIVLFGSSTKQSAVPGSDIDVMILIDDASIKWDQELIAWYREELEKLIEGSPYKKDLHINTIKLSTWWEDLMRGDPVILNILRYGEALIDAGGFFNPLKQLLLDGKIKSTPEAIYSCLQRAPMHLARSKNAELGAIEGLYWTMVDSSHAALIAAKVLPPSPEHIPGELKLNFVSSGKLKMKYVEWFRDLNILHKKIGHGEIHDLRGIEIDEWQKRTEEFLSVMAQLVNELIK
jgi:predicted nucleotidyltransferase